MLCNGADSLTVSVTVFTAIMAADLDCLVHADTYNMHFDVGSGCSQVHLNSSQVEVQGCGTDAGEDPGLQRPQLHTPVDVPCVQIQGHDAVGLHAK